MAALRTLAAAAAALSLVGQGHAWTVSLPPCLDPFQPFVYSGCYNDVTKPDTLSFKSDLPSDGMTVEKCVAECKGNGYRYAGLEYYGECYCGATVNGPAAPEGECNLPCNGNNTQHCGGNDRISIYQDPTFKPVDQSTIQDYRHLGCYTGNSADGSKSLAYPVEDITGQPWDQSTATTTKCLTLCKSKGFPFAGTEYGRECYCGVVMGNGTQPTDMGECNMPCNGNSSENCGGPSRINIWVSKELESLEPCGYVPPVSSSSSSSVETSTSTTSSSSSTSSSSTWYTTSTSYSSSSSSTRPPMTTTTPSTTAPPKTSTTTTSSAVCTTTVVLPPKCEYKCGNWCSEELPDWEDQDDCKASQNNCKLQVAACFKKAGWPGAIECFGFQKWCSDGANYCKGTNKGCSKNDWFKQKPPVYGGKPTTSTITVPCKPTAGPTTTSKPSTRSTTSKSSTRSTTSKPSTPSTTSKCPIPTVTNICKQPTNPKYGYSPENPVGGIDLPVVTCNDIKKDYQSGNQWKLYTDSDSSKCRSYPHSGVPKACQDACKEQFDDCNDVYAQGCKNNQPGKPAGPPGWPWKRAIAGRTVTWTDSYSAAVDKCKAQYNDCLAINRGVSYGGKCSAFGKGW